MDTYLWSGDTVRLFVVLFTVFPCHMFADAGSKLTIDTSVAVSQPTPAIDSVPAPPPPIQFANKNTDTTSAASLDKMVVTANRRQRLLNASQSISIIKPDEWIGTSKSIADVVAEQTGIQTRRYGGTGSFQTVSIRGVQGSEVLVLLDGIPLNSAMGGAVDLGTISPDRLEEIEVYRGVIPAEFDGNSLGGVINMKSKSSLKTRSLSSRMEIAAYGYQKYSIETNAPFSDRYRIFSSIVNTRSDNDWPYRDRNKTPYNTTDDTTRRVENHHYDFFEARIHPSFDLPNGRTCVSGIAYSNSEVGIPASEGSTNRTARHGEEMVTVASRLAKNDPSENGRIVLTPELGYVRLLDNDFRTSLDSSMGTSHDVITSSQNSFGTLTSDLHTVHAACIADLFFTDNYGGQVVVSGRHSDISATSRLSGFPHGDWPGNSQEVSFAGDLNGSLPVGPIHVGTTVGGSVKAIRSATRGGYNILFKKIIEPSDTIGYPWSVHGGFQCRRENLFNLFVNASRFSNVPGLREKYGTKGVVIPNPDLIEETGITVEGGIRILRERFFAEAVVFRTETRNGIVMLSDGKMIQPVNLAAGVTTGLEATLWAQLLEFISTDVRITLQNAENRSHFNNYYGKKLPNEPDLSVITGCSFGWAEGIELHYGFDYKSFFFRDFSNETGHRVPEDEGTPGLLFHNARISCKTFTHLEFGVSIRNFNQNSFRYEEMPRSAEGGYSWVLYPANEWCFTASYSF